MTPTLSYRADGLNTSTQKYLYGSSMPFAGVDHIRLKPAAQQEKPNLKQGQPLFPPQKKKAIQIDTLAPLRHKRPLD
jgi:hypothetical protein